MFRICLAGSVVKDTVFPFQGEPFTSLGGILYNIYGFSLLDAKDFFLFPVFFAKKEHIEEAKRLFPHLPISWEFIREWEATDENTIVYRTSSERDEDYRKKTPFLDGSHLPQGMDGYLINFIHQDDFHKGIPELSGIVYVDLHKRSFYLREWDGERLIGRARFIQCNREEFEVLKGKFDNIDASFLVTGGEEGAWLIEGERSFYMPAKHVQVVDPTGAGDVFGSAFLYTFLKTGDALASLSRAVDIATYSVTKRGICEEKIPGS